MELRWTSQNLTKEDLPPISEDYFKEVYMNPWINRTAIGFYFVGLVGIAGLALVAWFERSGQAGPYRTLINQIVSFNVESVRYLSSLINIKLYF